MNVGSMGPALVAALALIVVCAGCKPKAQDAVQDETGKAAGDEGSPEGEAGQEQGEGQDEGEDEDEDEADEDEGPESKAAGKKVLMIIACKDFRDEELEVPRKILEDASVKVTVASTAKSGCKGMMGATVDPDITIDDVEIDEFDAMLIVGGTGSASFYDDEDVLDLVKEADKEGLIVGAICLAPGILANAGIMKGRKATSYDSKEAKAAFEKGGVTWTGSNVTVDGVFVTANGPDASKDFGEKVLKMLE